MHASGRRYVSRAHNAHACQRAQVRVARAQRTCIPAGVGTCRARTTHMHSSGRRYVSRAHNAHAFQRAQVRVARAQRTCVGEHVGNGVLTHTRRIIIIIYTIILLMDSVCSPHLTAHLCRLFVVVIDRVLGRSLCERSYNVPLDILYRLLGFGTLVRRL